MVIWDEMNIRNHLGLLFKLAGCSIMFPATVLCTVEEFRMENPSDVGLAWPIVCGVGFVIWVIGDKLQTGAPRPTKTRTECPAGEVKPSAS